MLLVLSSQGFLKEIVQGEDPALSIWEITWSKMNPILPGLKEELFPPKNPNENAGVVEAAGK